MTVNDPITAFRFSCSGTDVQPRRDENSGKPCADIEAHSILVPTQDSKPLVAAMRSLLLPKLRRLALCECIICGRYVILMKYSGIFWLDVFSIIENWSTLYV